MMALTHTEKGYERDVAREAILAKTSGTSLAHAVLSLRRAHTDGAVGFALTLSMGPSLLLGSLALKSPQIPLEEAGARVAQAEGNFWGLLQPGVLDKAACG